MTMEVERLTQHIGTVLRGLRKERNWTLEQLAEATGVSKPMLGQIERGESNPTVVTLWKIASGLQVPFSAFLQNVEQPLATVVRKAEQPIVLDNDGKYMVRNVLAMAHPQSTDLFVARLSPGCSHAAEAHGAEVYEGVSVQKGRLTLLLADEQYVLNEGDFVYFQANINHSYNNDTDSVCEFLTLLLYQHATASKLP